MSRANLLRSISCADKKRIVREALANGWEFDGWDGGTHFILRWAATGTTLRSGATPGVGSWKRLAADIRRVSGVEVHHKGNRKRSRKAIRPSGFSITDTHPSSRRDEIDMLQARHEDAIGRLHVLQTHPSRGCLEEARRLLQTIQRTESRLRALSQPFEPFQLEEQ